jgi:hypothetical protein
VSIDARVQTVIHNEDGSGELRLIDRPAGPDGVPGIAGQSCLTFASAPHEVTALNGCDVWGGDSSLILGEIGIARREGYTRIVFRDDETFKRAVTEYHKNRRASADI